MRTALFPALMLTAAAASGICTAAHAEAKPQDRLTVGMDYVVPAYVAGAKFRTPEAIDTALAEDLARRRKAALAPMPANARAEVKLAALSESAPPPASSTVVPTGYAVRPMAIMRSDTDIKSWQQLRGRKVCLSEGGRYAGIMTARYGAVEKVYKAPADSLLALRTGECDAAVHDSAMLEEMTKLPEWKKFSARLPAGPQMTLAFVVPAADTGTAAYLKQIAADWRASGFLDQTMKKMVRHIAFEVYLDQNVPDCH